VPEVFATYRQTGSNPPGTREAGRRRIWIVDQNRWDEKAGLRRDAIGSQVIDALEAQEIKETGNEED
jgi:hypothetical protein